MGKATGLEEVRRLITGTRSALVLGHQYPDGDAIGSVLGLGLMLAAAGYDVQASWPEPFEMPEKYLFLPGMSLLVPPAGIKPGFGVSIALDCANERRLEELQEPALAVPLVNIDHHPDNSQFGRANLVDPAAASTSQIVYSLIEPLCLVLDRDSATCLYAGLVTDTGRFQFSNVTAETLRIAAQLVAAGVEPHRVYENIYQSDSLSYIRLAGDVLCRAVYDGDLGLIYGYVSQEDLSKFGVKMNETEDLIDNLRALRGHKIVALFKEQKDGTVRVSLRSRSDTDIGSIARKLGGGGHRVAAGYTSDKRGIDDALLQLKEEIIASGRDTDN